MSNTIPNLIWMSISVPPRTRMALETSLGGFCFGPLPTHDPLAERKYPDEMSEAIVVLIEAGLQKLLEEADESVEEQAQNEQAVIQILDFFKRNPAAERACRNY